MATVKAPLKIRWASGINRLLLEGLVAHSGLYRGFGDLKYSLEPIHLWWVKSIQNWIGECLKKKKEQWSLFLETAEGLAAEFKTSCMAKAFEYSEFEWRKLQRSKCNGMNYCTLSRSSKQRFHFGDFLELNEIHQDKGQTNILCAGLNIWLKVSDRLRMLGMSYLYALKQIQWFPHTHMHAHTETHFTQVEVDIYQCN